jgi:hypothetical protein
VSYTLRNSIVLGALLLIVLGIGTYIRVFNLPAQQAAIDKEVTRIDEELQNTPNLVNQYNDLSTTLGETQKRWENRNKDIPPVDVTAQTYAYFSRLIDLGGEVKLDMVFTGAQNRGNYGFNVYNLKGEAPFENFYRFFWYLENGRRLYKVQSMTVRGIEVVPKNPEEGEGGILVTFEANVQAFYASVPELSSSLGERSITPNALTADPFMPVISAGIPANTRGLVEIERSDLKAVVPGKAFVLDQENEIRTLEEGDEVYLGYVTRIVPEEGRLEATLNKGGIIERVELSIRYGPVQTGGTRNNK